MCTEAEDHWTRGPIVCTAVKNYYYYLITIADLYSSDRTPVSVLFTGAIIIVMGLPRWC